MSQRLPVPLPRRIPLPWVPRDFLSRLAPGTALPLLAGLGILGVLLSSHLDSDLDLDLDLDLRVCHALEKSVRRYRNDGRGYFALAGRWPLGHRRRPPSAPG